MKDVVSGGDNHETRRDLDGRSAWQARLRLSACPGHQPARATSLPAPPGGVGKGSFSARQAVSLRMQGRKEVTNHSTCPRLFRGRSECRERSQSRELSPGQATAPARARPLHLH